jgi:hypothetical protein
MLFMDEKLLLYLCYTVAQLPFKGFFDITGGSGYIVVLKSCNAASGISLNCFRGIEDGL